jgi:hypothetical protein
MSEETTNTIVTLTHLELHTMPEVNWENIRARLIEKGITEEQVNRCVSADPTPEGMRLEFAHG